MTEDTSGEIPEFMTLPCMIYHGERFNLLMFSYLSTSVIPQYLDNAVRSMANSIEAEQIDPAFKAQWEQHRKSGMGAQQEMRLYETLAAEMFVVRYVSTFLSYLAELLALVFQAKPETLSASTVTVKEVLEYGTQEALIAAVAERKIEDVSNKGMRQLHDYICRDHKVPLFENEEELKKAEYINAVRNILVHKRGIVDRKFLSNLPGRRGKDEVGRKVQLDEVFQCLPLLDRAVERIDAAMATKYNLKRLTAQDFWQMMVQIRQQSTTPPGEDTSTQDMLDESTRP